MVSSKYKQLYECRLPVQAVRFHQDPASEPDSQGYTGPDIPDLLKPMHQAPCLLKVKSVVVYGNSLPCCLLLPLKLWKSKAKLMASSQTDFFGRC